ncbi:SDR family oxidoreductase [Janthinobacterium psychrotolerans]|uniref:UDP-N-acetylglucosamine 4-epimerase n=1 Tax=Janthinobacterium psychrotolerans TaxID=1747903 RepID=A0A1A7BVZ8_9BURK|nr:SDR family oxidoreductase [Janthinobacterium psychrotolerans]OBV37746.1 UDP-N-acetylglucosamine 4-epimerase [Janthinobacterium psychrotolerans]
MADTSVYQQTCAQLRQSPRRWLVTGAAGFIGSHLVETLLQLGQTVRGLDNFSTGHRHNLAQVRDSVGQQAWRRFTLLEGDIRDAAACASACAGADIVLHQAALGSVPRSLREPQLYHDVNLGGFVCMLEAARAAGAGRLVYASSSAIYGDHPGLPKVEAAIGEPLSPYALSKRANELYAQLYGRCYGTEAVGLRYFNVFGPRQDPLGAYAAVIPRWLAAMLAGDTVRINGDGSTSRDFCYVANAVQANLLAATSVQRQAVNEVFNVAVNGRTSLLQLHAAMQAMVMEVRPGQQAPAPLHGGFRDGDVRHSQADISRAARLLGYAPTHELREGLRQTVAWYAAQQGATVAGGTQA